MWAQLWWQVHMIVWANEEVLCIFTHGPIGKSYDVATMHLHGPIVLEASARDVIERNICIGPSSTQ